MALPDVNLWRKLQNLPIISQERMDMIEELALGSLPEEEFEQHMAKIKPLYQAVKAASAANDPLELLRAIHPFQLACMELFVRLGLMQDLPRKPIKPPRSHK